MGTNDDETRLVPGKRALKGLWYFVRVLLIEIGNFEHRPI